MWNIGIIHSRTSSILILNDDVSLIPEYFDRDIRVALSLLSETKILTFNASWSHFIIDKDCVTDIGWFDEHLIGIGNEDGEYAERYSRITGSYIPTLKIDAFLNITDSTRDLDIVSAGSKYSLFNCVLNNLRNKQPSQHPYINPYPMNEWQNRMIKWLSESDVSILEEAMKTESENS
jgi:predicted glycosyltransferase involved in capsule biosynthesis